MGDRVSCSMRAALGERAGRALMSSFPDGDTGVARGMNHPKFEDEFCRLLERLAAKTPRPTVSDANRDAIRVGLGYHCQG